MIARRAVITGCGAYLPERIVTNDDLAGMVETSDSWIVERSGIRRRHIAAEGELTSDLALKAARPALEMAGLEGNDLDAVIVATATPDNTFPATAARVQAALGMTGGFAFDIGAVCSGFVYGLTVANSLILSGQAHRVLVIGAETFSRIVDWTDRTTCVLFGDGAGAAVLEGRPGNGTNADRGILSCRMHSDGRHYDLLKTDGGPSLNGLSGHIRMNGPEVFRHAVSNLASVGLEVFSATGLDVSDLDWVVPHQANKRIIDGTVKKLGIDPEKVILTIEDQGNTSAASIPLALAAGVADGRIKPGHLVLLEGMGGGLAWGAVLLRF